MYYFLYYFHISVCISGPSDQNHLPVSKNAEIGILGKKIKSFDFYLAKVIREAEFVNLGIIWTFHLFLVL